MPLPEQAVKQGEKAEELLKQAYGEVKSEGGEVSPEVATPAVEAPVATPAPAAKTGDEGADPNDPSWKQRYLVLRGKLYAEVPRLNAENKALRKEIEDLKSKVPAASLVKPEEVEHYGPEFIDMVKRAAEEIAAPLRARIAELTASQEPAAPAADDDESSLSKLFGEIAAKHPDWEQVNADPNFLRWLAQTDPATGMKRQLLVSAAVDNRDSEYVIDVLDKWKALHSAAPAATPAAPPAAKPKTESPSPDSVQGEPTRKPTDKKTWTVKEVNDFYAKWRSGRIKDADATRIEQDIDAARAEGRITR